MEIKAIKAVRMFDHGFMNLEMKRVMKL